ncbi:hypothetical protein [Poritiphilus flavus]|uniref:Uncharacterized protein n=1 Tax=Poritiphilus flavus TaxID=2697053 RepID=A0A6L9EEN3_9FLAO|nr:hypothetical protein [Poritiphilus flavus]NAS13186.1 hypothetical protein [Poritiphilus flavus]
MKTFLEFAKLKLNVDNRLVMVYCVLYFLWGLGMNWFGAEVEIARFTFWWQVITCYILYMVPISLLLRGLPFHMQYAYGLVAMGFLEFCGYWFQTSCAYTNNILDQLFGIRNFSLGMALFFGLYFPLGNWAANRIYQLVFHKKTSSDL